MVHLRSQPSGFRDARASLRVLAAAVWAQARAPDALREEAAASTQPVGAAPDEAVEPVWAPHHRRAAWMCSAAREACWASRYRLRDARESDWKPGVQQARACFRWRQDSVVGAVAPGAAPRQQTDSECRPSGWRC